MPKKHLQGVLLVGEDDQVVCQNYKAIYYPENQGESPGPEMSRCTVLSQSRTQLGSK